MTQSRWWKFTEWLNEHFKDADELPAVAFSRDRAAALLAGACPTWQECDSVAGARHVPPASVRYLADYEAPLTLLGLSARESYWLAAYRRGRDQGRQEIDQVAEREFRRIRDTDPVLWRLMDLAPPEDPGSPVA